MELIDLTTPRYSYYFSSYSRGLKHYIPAGHSSLARIKPDLERYGIMCWVKISQKNTNKDGAIFTVSTHREKLFNLFYDHDVEQIAMEWNYDDGSTKKTIHDNDTWVTNSWMLIRV